MALNLDALAWDDGSTKADVRTLSDAERKAMGRLEAKFAGETNKYVAEFNGIASKSDRDDLRAIISAYVATRDGLSVTFPVLVPDKWGTVLHFSSPGATPDQVKAAKQAAEEVREMLGKGYRTGERKLQRGEDGKITEPGGPVITRTWDSEAVAKVELGKLRVKLGSDPRVKTIADVALVPGHGKAHWNTGDNVTVRIAGAK
jgi:hypothetical protein